MPSTEDQPRPGARSGARARAPTVLGAALALIALAALAVLAVLPLAGPEPASTAPPPEQPFPRPPEQPSPTVPSEPGSPRPAVSPPAALGARADVAVRLREILRVREQALGQRDMRLLETIYTTDCPCLRSGRAAIARLLSDRAVWRGRAIAVEVTSVDRVSDRIWVAVALFSSRAFRIEGEDGTLIRVVPAERQRYRFVLARAAPGGQWLIGDASLLREGGS